ncbi:ExbD/TolR family protein [Catalinimonas alkaloidigena]|nr:hypothetical protein [Catalinimonas alkaloidigena]
MLVFSMHEPFALSPEARTFYNRFIAFVAYILGQNICLQIWYARRKPQQGLRTRRHRLSIGNDQRFVLWPFLDVASRLGFILPILFNIVSFFLLDFYPDYRYLFVMLVLVIFGQSWLTLRRLHKGRLWRPMLGSLGGMLLFGFLVARWDLSAPPTPIVQFYQHYQLDLPSSIATPEPLLGSVGNHFDLLVARAKNDPQLSPTLLYKYQPLDRTELIQLIYGGAGNSYFDEHALPVRVNLIVDRSVSLQFVRNLAIRLRREGVDQVFYATVPFSSLLPPEAYRARRFFPLVTESYICDEALQQISKASFADPAGVPLSPNCFQKLFGPSLQVRVDSAERVFLNQQPTTVDQLPQQLRQRLADPSHPQSLQLLVDEHISMACYAQVQGALFYPIQHKREQAAHIRYGKKLAQLDDYELEMIVRDFPWNLPELSRLEKQYLDHHQP